MTQQGKIYWLAQQKNENHAHPHVVIQANIETVVVCALTTNMKKVSVPGNILLEAGEAGLPKQSIVDVSQMATVAKSQLGEYIGRLSKERIQQIHAGVAFIQKIVEQP